jgi:hypothetical protein
MERPQLDNDEDTMNIIKRIIIGTAIGLGLGLVITHPAPGLVSFDNVRGVHGVSIGTDTDYCSLEFKVISKPMTSCEHVG